MAEKDLTFKARPLCQSEDILRCELVPGKPGRGGTKVRLAVYLAWTLAVDARHGIAGARFQDGGRYARCEMRDARAGRREAAVREVHELTWAVGVGATARAIREVGQCGRDLALSLVADLRVPVAEVMGPGCCCCC